jgi:hypothetical protein
MCWPRSQPTDPQAFETNFTSLVAQTRSIDELASAVCRTKEDGTLHDLVLFIDEPERNPYLQKLQSTPQREAS